MLDEFAPLSTHSFQPPATLLADADHHLGFAGSLLEHAATRVISLERIPHMTDVERAAYLTRRAGARPWSCYPLRSGAFRYSVVVVREVTESATT